MAKHANTMRTMLGFIRSVLGRWIPSLRKSERLDDIYNYLLIDGVYATSGQPSESQFQLIRDSGYEKVINLAPTSMLENSLIDEDAILERLGMRYVHIPVDFKAPSESDFEQFIAELTADNANTWVHCAANMRVSAFTYRYRKEVLNHDEVQAKQDLDKIWEPMGVWSEFVQR